MATICPEYTIKKERRSTFSTESPYIRDKDPYIQAKSLKTTCEHKLTGYYASICNFENFFNMFLPSFK